MRSSRFRVSRTSTLDRPYTRYLLMSGSDSSGMLEKGLVGPLRHGPGSVRPYKHAGVFLSRARQQAFFVGLVFTLFLPRLAGQSFVRLTQSQSDVDRKSSGCISCHGP